MADFSGLGRSALEAMAAAGDEILECRRVLARTGGTVIAEALGGASAAEEWSHYPVGNVSIPARTPSISIMSTRRHRARRASTGTSTPSCGRAACRRARGR